MESRLKFVLARCTRTAGAITLLSAIPSSAQTRFSAANPCSAGTFGVISKTGLNQLRHASCWLRDSKDLVVNVAGSGILASPGLAVQRPAGFVQATAIQGNHTSP